MDAAVVTIKLNVREFDLIRKALDSLSSEDWEIGKNAELDAPVRHAAKAEHLQVNDLKQKLGL